MRISRSTFFSQFWFRTVLGVPYADADSCSAHGPFFHERKFVPHEISCATYFSATLSRASPCKYQSVYKNNIFIAYKHTVPCRPFRNVLFFTQPCFGYVPPRVYPRFSPLFRVFRLHGQNQYGTRLVLRGPSCFVLRHKNNIFMP